MEVKDITHKLRRQQHYKDLGGGYHLIQNTDPDYQKQNSKNIQIHIGHKQFEVPNLFYRRE